jgi:uncharacterized protein (DUF1800 family)
MTRSARAGHSPNPASNPLATLITPDASLHIARRCTYGITPATHAAISSRGAEAWIDRQLDPSAIEDSVCDRYLRRYPLLGLRAGQLARKVSIGSYDQMNQTIAASLVRAVWSERQVYEMMVEFWWNHFNIGLPESDVWNVCGMFDNEIRSHALGRFDELLLAVATSPAMLIRLNQNLSVGNSPNENYGREMLELHTVGVNAGYTQQDVRNASLLLTGWGLNAAGTTFRYDPANHHVGALTVMSFEAPKVPATSGASVIRNYLNYLAHHPCTATHLATKLAIRFVSDDPPAGLVSRLAKTYLEHDTAITPVLKQLFTSPEFQASVGQKVRRPIEAVAASLRILDYSLKNNETADIGDVVFSLGVMGQAPLGWPQPNGYPDTASAWMSASAVQAEWGMHLRLTGAWWTETLSFPGLRSLLGNPPASMPSGAFVDLVAARLVSQTVAPDQKAKFLAFLDRRESEPIGAGGLAGLAMFAKVVLDSPYFAVR